MAIYVPSFWDYLGQGVQKGFEGFQGERDRRRQEAMQNFSVMNQLFQSGAVDNSSLQEAAQRIGVTTPIAPNAPQMRRTIMNAPEQDLNIQVPMPGVMGATAAMPQPAVRVRGRDSFTDDQRRFAGLPTSLELGTEAFQRRQLDIRNRALNGDTISDEEAIAAGIQPAWQIDAEKRKAIDPTTTSAAERYAAGIVNRIGRIPQGNIEGLADQAFSQWMRDREGAKIGTLTPQESQYARSFFSAAVRDLWMQQQGLDIQRMNADTNRLNAGNRSGGLNIPQMVNALSRISEGQTKVAENMLQGPMKSIIPFYANQSPEQIPEAYRTAVQAYNDAKARAEQYKNASALFASGHITPEQAQALMQQAAGLGGAPPASAPTGDTGNIQLPGGGAPSMNDQQMSAAVSRLRQVPRERRAAVIDAAVEAGQLSAADAQKLKGRL